eukprot:SAG31_NODE_2950_length_4870_cov_3.507860_1_plen_189_part_00
MFLVRRNEQLLRSVRQEIDPLPRRLERGEALKSCDSPRCSSQNLLQARHLGRYIWRALAPGVGTSGSSRRAKSNLARLRNTGSCSHVTLRRTQSAIVGVGRAAPHCEKYDDRSERGRVAAAAARMHGASAHGRRVVRVRRADTYATGVLEYHAYGCTPRTSACVMRTKAYILPAGDKVLSNAFPRCLI